MTTKRLIYDLDYDQLSEVLSVREEPQYRVKQIWHTIYRELNDWPDSFSTIPTVLRQQLSADFNFQSLSKETESTSEDKNTQKLLFRTRSGHKIETVLMRYERRRTVCISTQSGCGVGCPFCASGQMGLQLNLSSGEIIEQVLYFARQLKMNGESLTNVVVMGMGEPFQNYDATMSAIDTLNHPAGYNFGARRFTVSTVGLVPMIERFTREHRQVNLAVSLHAATNELRDQLVPVNRRYPVEKLMQACREYVAQTNRRITFEWALIEGINDSLEQAQALADLVNPFLCHVNLIPLNPTKDFSKSASPVKAVSAFQDYLHSRGISCTTRMPRGIEIQAGCGQLAAEQ
jgi:23S rRNA (adenine2503-C2)-methyltransferase